MSVLLALWAAFAACPQQAASPRFAPVPARADVGQPVRFVLALEHEAETRVALAEPDAFAPAADAEGVALDAPPLVCDGPPERERLVLADGRVRTSFVWTARALEGGTWAPASAALELDGPGGARALIALPEPLTVEAALAEGEDTPQAPTGFPPAPPERMNGALLLGSGLALLAALALALVLVRRARRRAPRAAPTARAEERLATLGPRAARPGEEASVAREIAAVVRETLDKALGASRVALTDPEWLAALDSEARLTSEERALARTLLGALEGARYGGPRPTRFALEDALGRARTLVEAARRVEAQSRSPAKRGRAA